MGDRLSFLLYINQQKHIKLLNREQKGDLLEAIYAYAAGDVPTEMDGMTMMALSFITDQMDRDYEKYLETSSKRREAGKQGGRPKNTPNQNEAKKANGFFEKQTKTKKPDNDTDNDTDNDKDLKNINVEQSPTKRKKSEYQYKDVIDYLNAKTGNDFRATSKDSRNHIGARFAEGYTLDDFRKVIDIKCAKWKGTEYQDYLRPSTLFGTKFGEYLNEQGTVKSKPKQNAFHNFEQRDNSYQSLVMEQVGSWMNDDE